MSSPDSIERVQAREVLNFRGDPTVEAEVVLADGSRGRAVVPVGTSAGSNEAKQLRDSDPKRFRGKGVLKAVENVHRVIAPAIKGMSAYCQEEVDRRIIELDGTPDKSRLGANAILGVSMATAQAAAVSRKVPLFRHLGGDGPFWLPVPAFDTLNGGVHAEQSVDIQEYLVIPVGVASFTEALVVGHDVYETLREVLKKRGHTPSEGTGPVAAPLRSNREGVEVIAEAIERAGYKLGSQVYIGLDCATTHLYKNGKYVFAREGVTLTADRLVEMWDEWVRAYPIISIEDGMAEEDWEGWQALAKRLGGKVQLVGDDFFTTNPSRVKRGISLKAANAVLVKPNQVGSLSETLETIRLAQGAGWAAQLSTRSRDTEDTTISDLAVQPGAGQIKIGPPNGHCVVKINRLLRIQEELGSKAVYAGCKAFRLLK